MNEDHRITGYGTLATVWLALIALTALTVGITRVEVGGYKVVAALAIACVKSAMVIAVFMQMKHEGRLLRWLLFLALLTLAIYIGFTFFDLLYR